ncbi:adenosine 3'-phospho 5'-phosphosulfate transporter 1 isoform X2 [Cimex lectularius]|uniref:Adenosine 3'-phospho 5'-phosphosulfate transporter 1 n=1 Tax=Cimex lectularius TaxID=79782 RepID=A0A8I6TDY5_CIMLE|nr:adenosine 3'-phospho 5'-phosphosulfate transporter 1 isoform X2 [Cimex lectularius]
MAYNGPQIVICTVIVVSFGLLYGITSLLQSSSPSVHDEGSFQSTWMYRLLINLIGYSTILLPGYFIFKYVRVTKYLERSGAGCLSNIIDCCINGREPGLVEASNDSPVRTLKQDTLLLLFCFVGLQGTYLTWGILQEKVMTQEYTNSAGDVGHFKDSQFLVFVNRILAFTLSGSYLLLRKQPKHTMPLYKYAYCSFSNIMSSWCQYEALKYVSFPSQVLAKASKLIPVMIMGKIVSKQKYEYYEYVTAVLISIGMTFFMLSSAPKKDETVTTMSGIILLGAYMTFDSFTSNWQGALFTQYKVSPVQMMCCVNLFSCLFTSVSLFQQGAFSTSLQFMATFPKFTIDCLLISISSGAGQLFVFFTIYSYGPVIFVIIMTIRQGLAILLSCLIYNHTLPPLGIFGIMLVFGAIFLRIYCNQRLKAIRLRLHSVSSSKV